MLVPVRLHHLGGHVSREAERGGTAGATVRATFATARPIAGPTVRTRTIAVVRCDRLVDEQLPDLSVTNPLLGPALVSQALRDTGAVRAGRKGSRGGRSQQEREREPERDKSHSFKQATTPARPTTSDCIAGHEPTPPSRTLPPAFEKVLVRSCDPLTHY